MSSPNDMRKLGSFRPHPRSPNTMQKSYSQYPSTSEGFVPLHYSSPISNYKRFNYNQKNNRTSLQNQKDNFYIDNGSNFSPFKNRGSLKGNYNNSFNRNKSNGNKFNRNFFNNQKNFNKKEHNINDYYHPLMLSNPWEHLMDEYNKLNDSNKVENNSDQHITDISIAPETSNDEITQELSINKQSSNNLKDLMESDSNT